MRHKSKQWTAAELTLLGTDTDAAIAKRLGRSLLAVQIARTKREIPAHFGRLRSRPWGTVEVLLFDTYDDAAISKLTRRPLVEIADMRKQLKRKRS